MKRKTVRKTHTLPARIFAVFCCVFLILPFAGCNLFSGSGNPSSEIGSFGEIPSETLPALSPAEIHALMEERTVSDAGRAHDQVSSVSEPNPGWEAPTPLLDFSSGLVLDIHNDEEFNAFMKHYLALRKTNFCFNACDGFTINNDVLLYRFSLPYVSTTWTELSDGKVYWDITIRYYPGTYIADAYFSGDTSSLEPDELKTYEIARDFIENKVLPEESFVKRERLIHDFICEKTVYSNPKTGEKVPRHCTAVGLLLDGKANCQGYTDCCNMLCRMAGMMSESQSGYGDGTPHVWNIIKVGRNWYSMDITYDDTTFQGDGSGYPGYLYFNAGKDILEVTHSLREKSELIPIKDESDENYFYYSDEFTDKAHVESEADAITQTARLLENSVVNNEKYVSVMAENCSLYSSDIVDPIQDEIKGAPSPITIHTFRAGSNTFILGEPLY